MTIVSLFIQRIKQLYRSYLYRSINVLVVLATLLVFASASLAEVRVIVEYNSPEHRVLRVVELPSSRPALVSDHLAATPKNVPTPAGISSKVKLLWFNVDGALISTELINDPRLTHSPLTGSSQAPTVVGLDKGAFMVTGPSESTVLEIHMPANATLGLDQQLWRMVLER